MSGPYILVDSCADLDLVNGSSDRYLGLALRIRARLLPIRYILSAIWLPRQHDTHLS